MDDHPGMQAGLVTVLTSPPDPVDIVAVVASVEDLDALTGAPAPDVVILDLGLPRGRSGSDAVAYLVPRCKVIVYTIEKDRQVLARALRAGAWTLLDKIVDNATVRSAVRAAYRGESFHGAPEILAAQWAASIPEVDLTPAEERVLSLMVENYDNKAIRARLNIGDKALESHISHIFQKLRDADILDMEPSRSDRANTIKADRERLFLVGDARRSWRGRQP